MRTGRMKRGFTLIETVVTVGIVAAMAAVVIPQVAKQFDVADPTRVQNDLKNLQTAIETYYVNVKQLPADLDDLANAVTVGATGDTTITSAITLTALGGTENTLWKGPYIDLAVSVDLDTDQLMPTGFGATIVESFVCYNATNNEHGISDGTGAAAADDQACPTAVVTGEQGFIAVQITGIACSTTAGSTFMQINELFDGASEASADASGRIRCFPGTGAQTKDNDVNVVYFLAVPLVS